MNARHYACHALILRWASCVRVGCCRNRRADPCGAARSRRQPGLRVLGLTRHRIASVCLGIALVLLVGSATWADEADDQYTIAAGHYALERWRLAAEGFEAFVQAYPDHPRAHEALFGLGESLLQMGRLEEAEARFRQYGKEFPDRSLARLALFRAGESAYLNGKRDLAQSELAQFNRQYPDDALNAHVLVYLGDLALQRGDAVNAEQYFRDALTRFPQGPRQDECRLGLARALENRGQAEEAARYYLAVSGKPGSPLALEAQYQLGALQYALGRYPEAIESFKALLAEPGRHPLAPAARLGTGWSLLKLQRWSEAERCFAPLVSDPKLGSEARYWLGIAQKAQKNWPAAIQTLRQAARNSPEHALAPAMLFHAGDAARQAGQWPAADALFDEVLALPAADNAWADDALRGKIQLALAQQDYATLDSLVAQFVQRCPESPLRADVVRMWTRALLDRKQYQRAQEAIQSQAQAGSGAEGLEDRYLLVLAYQGLGRFQEALAELEPVLRVADGPLAVHAQLTEIALLMSVKRFAEVPPLVERVLASQPSDDVVLNARGNLAVCYARTGQLAQAKTIYGELAAKYAGHALMRSVQELLAEAALEAGDAEWSARLFAELAEGKGSADEELRGLAGLAWSQLKAGQLEQAAATFQRVLQNNPPSPLAAEAALAGARILEKLGQTEPALSLLDLVIRQYPEKQFLPEALWSAARLRDTQGQKAQAVGLYERLAKEFPQFRVSDSVLYQWAWCLEDLGRREESNAAFERLRNEYPTSFYAADATFRLAQRAMEAQDLSRARQLAESVLAKNPEATIRENTLYLLGQLAAVEGHWDQARQSFETLLADHPESPLRLMAEYGVAEAAFRQSRFDEAAERFAALAPEVQKRDDAWLAIIPLRWAQSLGELKRWREAYEVASQIEARYPRFEHQYEADYVLGRCLAAQADFDGARAAYRKVIRSPTGAKTETAAKAQLLIAESYFHQKNYAAALREYLGLEHLYAYPTIQAAAVFQAAKCHEQLREWSEAVGLYTHLMRVYPDSPQAKEAPERLAEAKRQAAITRPP